MTAPHRGRSGGKEQKREGAQEGSEASGGPHFISSVPPNTVLVGGPILGPLTLGIVLALPMHHCSLAALWPARANLKFYRLGSEPRLIPLFPLIPSQAQRSQY